MLNKKQKQRIPKYYNLKEKKVLKMNEKNSFKENLKSIFYVW